jgi:hypothetical protein
MASLEPSLIAINNENSASDYLANNQLRHIMVA